jgi:hypothetical protein
MDKGWLAAFASGSHSALLCMRGASCVQFETSGFTWMLRKRTLLPAS